MARAKKSKSNVAELEGLADPRAPIDSVALLSACQAVLTRLETDLVERATSSPAVTRALEVRYQAEKAAERTAESFAGWTELLATQVAAAWVLSCVFVRTLEDRGLLKQARLAGPGAEDSQRQFFQLAPSLTERDYLLTVFREVAHYPAAASLFDTEHSPVWKLSPSSEAAKALLGLFRLPNAKTPAFRFGQASTRFLGDLYQDLSEDVRKRYALLQTPDFIESFILDRALEPAIARFGLDDTTLIDPTCGSGHFLLGAFDRLFDHRLRAEPGIDPRLAAVKALDCVYGADINPYAVAIARFRLTLSFLDKAGYAKLADAPAIPLHLAVGDSLRINPQHPQTELWHQDGVTSAGWLGEVFTLEDDKAAKEVLFRQYAAVVGNPPYITEKDSARREQYRALYPRTAFRTFSLAAPFCERFFQLARARGFVGQITANSFMKREFGKRMIEEYLPTINLTLVVNTAGAFIPGHGTPTVLLFGTSEKPIDRGVAAVLSKRGEPSTPSIPAKGQVWVSIVEHCDDPGFENDFISTARIDRGKLSKHPWSLGGGAAVELMEFLEARAQHRVGDVVEQPIGRAARLGADEVFIVPVHVSRNLNLPSTWLREVAIGEAVRDWTVGELETAVFPYDATRSLCAFSPDDPGSEIALRYLWRWKPILASRVTFQGGMSDAGLHWYEYMQYTASANLSPLSIVFAEVATHNHFVLDLGGRLFKQSAPVIKFKEGVDENDYLSLLTYLNSSTACFYLRQVAHQKQMMGADSIRHSDPTTVTFAFNGGSISLVPLPPWTSNDREELASAARDMQRLALEFVRLGPRHALKDFSAVASDDLVTKLKTDQELTLHKMVGLQEWMDWRIYKMFGLPIPDAAVGQPTGTRPGLRAFEVRQHESGRLITIDNYETGSEADASAIDSAVSHRLICIKEQELVAELEQSQFKRRWIGRQGKFNKSETGFEQDLRVASELEALVLLEKQLRDAGSPVAANSLKLPPRLSPSQQPDERTAVKDLLHANSVPFLAAELFTSDGYEKHLGWRAAWQFQRRLDSGEKVEVPVPETYEPRDYRKSQYQSLRGKYDVPTERFISYPYCESDNDGEPVYGWAGWDFLQRATALWSLYVQRRDNEGWTADRLIPMLVGLHELIPWVKQWHNEPSEEYGGLRMGENFSDVLEGECRRHSLTLDNLLEWRPPQRSRGGKTSSGRATKVKRESKEVREEEDAARVEREREDGDRGISRGDKQSATKRRTRGIRSPRNSTPCDAWVGQVEARLATWLREQGAKFHDHGDRSYVTTIEDNVLAISAETRKDLDGGSGNELGTEDRPGKVLAPWSSSALAINFFEHWRHRDAKPMVRALGSSGLFPVVRFEAQFSTGLRGGRANLDVVLEDDAGRRIAIESKFLEPYRGSSNGSEAPIFSAAYFADPRLWNGIPDLHDLAKALVDGSKEFTRLDAPQLIKHILALRHASKPFELVHLWYRPDADLPEVTVIEQEIAAFRAVTDRDDVRFRAMTYQELFARLCIEAPEQVEYLAYLRNRYFTISTTPENQ